MRPRSWSKAMEKYTAIAMMTRAPEADLQKILTQERHRVHLVGVAGSGMSGIAALLLELGHEVSGSDKVGSSRPTGCSGSGCTFIANIAPKMQAQPSIIIYSSAIKEENPILASARESGKLLLRRAEALAAIMRGKRGIIIAGMHGKTTTSADDGACVARGRLASVPLCRRGNSDSRDERALGCARRIFRRGR